MDFVSNGLAHGRRFRCLNVVDDYTQECAAIEVDTSLPGLRVKQMLHHRRDLLLRRPQEIHSPKRFLQITERTLRPFDVVPDTPFFYQASCMAQRDVDRTDIRGLLTVTCSRL